MGYVTPSGFSISLTQSQLSFHPFGIGFAKGEKNLIKQRPFSAARGANLAKKKRRFITIPCVSSITGL
jgi:hypothetical protein